MDRTQTRVLSLKVEALSHRYPTGTGSQYVLKNLRMEADRGEFVAVMGPSGCGKTTLLNLLGGLERPSSGSIEVAGLSLAMMTGPELAAYRREKVSFIFQFFNLIPNLTLAENVRIGLEVMRLSKDEREYRIRKYLTAVGLWNRAGQFPGQISGGMQQRVAVARALARETELILADEPTGNLDQETGESILELMQSVQAKTTSALILITHDPKVAERADRTLRLHEGILT